MDPDLFVHVTVLGEPQSACSVGTPQQGCTIDPLFYLFFFFLETGSLCSLGPDLGNRKGGQSSGPEVPGHPRCCWPRHRKAFQLSWNIKMWRLRKAVVVDGELRFQGHLNWD